MLRVYSCIAYDHDIRLVLVAGITCLLAALTAFTALDRARASGKRRRAWLILTAFVSGIGIWATHFLAMLAYQPHIPTGYDLGLTLLSIAAAVCITGAGWALTLCGESRLAALGGAVVGVGIATMHYVGMSAMKVGGRLIWDERLIAVSVIIGILLSAVAAADRRPLRNLMPWRPALLLTAAICGLHFTAMAAARILPDPRFEVPNQAIGSDMLTVLVVAVTAIILSISFAVVLFDRRLARQAAEEAQRIRAFADAAIEGLVVIDGDRIVDANRSFLRLAGYESRSDLPETLAELLPELDPFRAGLAPEGKSVECRLLRADGEGCDVEILLRTLDWDGKKRRVLAIRDVTERKEAAARIAHLANHDTLTGLPNRAVFTEQLARTVERAAAAGTPVAVLCIALDGFKAINDLHGHAGGDELLVGVAQRFRAIAAEDELVARLGGDEFAIIQAGEEQPARAGRLSSRIAAAFGEPFDLAGQSLKLSASIGVALFPDDAATPGDLIKNADMALSRAKAEGRGLIRFYEAAMDDALRQRRQLAANLAVALDAGDLAVHYQPLAELETGRIIGFEALVRWTHPQLGPISPDVFVRLAEEAGLIVRLGEWVLREACGVAAEWNPPLKLSVNLSPLQFLQEDLVGSIERVLAETGLDSRRLDLEITEGMLIRDADGALAILQRLKALGVQVSMDDFGTGYSSLSYFRKFPFDKVKIDRSFVRDITVNPQARAIIRSVIGLGRGLGMPVVAEGVETMEQLEALRDEGCDQVQGYLISRPNPIGHFEGVVLDRSSKLEVTPLRRRA